MRPIRLALSGFTSFTEEQELDFAGLDVFAIGGATGAGKSSLLDAMLFALFGRVPRLGGNEQKPLISLDRERLCVSFDFGLREKIYRVVRTLSRRGSSEAQLERLEEGVRVAVLAEGIRNVNDKVVALLGLNYEAFRRAVILPQGQFDALLRGNAAERRGILKELLEFGIYEKMRGVAKGQATRFGVEEAQLRQRIEADFGFATDGEQARIAGEHVAAAARREDLERELSALGSRRGELRRVVELAGALEVARRERDAGPGDVAAREVERERLELGRRAATVTPHLRAAEEADGRYRAASGVRETAAARAQEVEAEWHLAAEALARCEGAEEEQALREARVVALRAVLPKREERRRIEVRRREVETRAVNGRGLAEAAEKRAGDAERRRVASETLRSKSATERDACLFDADRFGTLDALGDLARSTRTARERCRDGVARVMQAEAAVVDLRQVRDLAFTDESEKTIAWESAEVARETADRARDVATRHIHVAALRAEIAPGQPCPVCEQRVTEALPALPVSDNEVEVREAKAAETQAAAHLADARTTRKLAEARLADAVVREATVRAARDEEERTLAAALAALPGTPGVEVPGNLEDALLAEHAALAKKRGVFETATERFAKADRDLTVAAMEVANERARGAELLARVEEDERDQRALEGEMKRLLGEIAAVTTGDPAAELAVLEAAIEACIVAVRRATSAVGRARESGAAAEASRSHAVAEEERRQEEQVRAMERLLTAVLAAGFSSPAAARDAWIADEDLSRRTAVLTESDAARRGLEARIESLTRDLGGRTASPAELADVEQTIADYSGERDARIAEMARLESEGARVAAARITRVELESRLGVTEASHERFSRLARLLQDNAFQAFLLEERFRELVEGASVRLLEWTGRFSLRFENDSFFVADQETGEATRSTDTLSGGETFLTSLALALELSEQIQRIGGNVTLSCLFVDEGFGSLDDERLEAVANALETLGGHGRMVGIVSHLPELNRRLPARVTVERTPDGSRISVS